ncbi:MlaC/ttg2D family ABC transporter substrate-binding protein [Ferrimonas marina]|uniref:Phospholipid transport system substrate-binding protein n=1 Tax=Ferrimonas marina TaxID=299255 RepID=A0A1M5Y1W4_9GAMM|nr:ABC transporter substrate-binding protein [Ferrimonas marina]SHI06060.1 phospholipid transport system substrate-binding protein [Ferrimonas marina]
MRAMLAAALAVMMWAAPAWAEHDSSDPYKLVQQVAEATFQRFEQDKEAISADPDHLKLIVEEEMMPYVDHRYAALKVVGPQARQIDRAELQRFTDVFRQYMIATFAQAFTEYTNQTVEFQPGQAPADRRIVTVGVTIVDPSRPAISVQFKARRNNKTGQWKAIDLIAEGVSLLATKEAEIGGLIRRQGIRSVSDMLAEQSAKPLTPAKRAS